MRRSASPFVALVALPCALALAPVSSYAQSGGAAEFVGRYVLDSARSDRIDARVEETVRGMNFVKRPIARRRLLKVNRAALRFELRFAGDTGRLVVPAESPIPLGLRRDAQAWTNAEGERFAVTAQLSPGIRQTLVVQFKAEDGERTNLYRLDDDGRGLSLTVTVESPQLGTPLRYTLRYRRD